MVNTRSNAKLQSKNEDAHGSAQHDPVPKPEMNAESAKKSSSHGRKSSASSVVAQKKRLELEAAKQKTRIQMELLEKQLEIDLAAVEEKYSPHASESDSQDGGNKVEEWLKRSHHELEKQRANDNGISHGPLFPPSHEDGTIGPVQQLACALKELVAAQATTSHNANLLSRISTPRELPIFSGDPLEWLSFKNAYEESTEICQFTDKENLWRLRKCLRGAAREAVAALLMSATTSEIVISTLKLQFGNADVILSRIMLEVKKLGNLSAEYHREIVPFSVKIKNYVAAARALERNEYLNGMEVANIILAKLPTTLLAKWADYSYPLITAKSPKPRLDMLSEFLTEEAVKVSTCSASLLHLPRVNNTKYKNSHYEVNNPETVLVHSDNSCDYQSSDLKCTFCSDSKHNLINCKKFKKSLNRVKWSFVKRTGMCFKCLTARHNKQSCPAAPCDVDGCGQPHHRLLHYIPSSRKYNSAETQSDTTLQSVNHINTNTCAVLLKVVPVNIHGPNGLFSTSALLDDGSTVSMMSASLAARAGLRGCTRSMRVHGAWNNTELSCDVEQLNLTLSCKHSDKFKISVYSVKELNLPAQNLSLVNCNNYNHLYELKDKLCVNQCKPEILIGQDNYHLLLPLETVMGGANEPCATRTPMGWCLHGRVPRVPVSMPAQHSSLFVTTNTDPDCDLRNIHEDVQRYFAIESMGVSTAVPRQNSADQRAWNHLEQTSSLNKGIWQVGLPWKNSSDVMPDSLPTAMARLRGVELKMKRNKEYAQRYHERVQHLLLNNYAEKLVNEESTSKVWYLPHFGVDNPNKKKLRLVFDAAAKTNGVSLNDYLQKGPDLLMSLFGIMLRFREYKVAVTADIKDMFLRVKIREQDRNALRFMFRGDPMKPYDPKMLQEPIQTYVMTSLIFGANCSPFIAQFVKNKNAQRFMSTMPTAAAAIHTQHYMDDYIDSLPDEQTASQLTKDIMHIHEQGNFELRNWNSNSDLVLSSLPKERLGVSAVKFKVGEQYEGERTLGLIWHPTDDTLRFDVSFKKVPEEIINGKKRPTKREMLRVVMSIFDVYGFLSPFTINGKIILQETWRSNIGWDDPVNDETHTKWLKWICLLQTLREIKLSRHYPAAARSRVRETENGFIMLSQSAPESTSAATSCATSVADKTSAKTMTPHNLISCYSSTDYRNLEMHIFCDASTAAYCAVAYWRWIDEECKTRVAFIASKCRVAGNKATTVPRLELQAAVLAARLADSITKEHRIKAEKRIFWCDSTTVLHWIRNDERNYKIYIANRLGEIDELTQINEWRYVPTKLNVADIATRETYDSSVLQDEWLHGPTFLYKNYDDWPHDVIKPENKNNSVQLECLIVTQIENENLPVPEPTKFSSWLRLLRCTSKVLTFLDCGVRAIIRSNKREVFTYDFEGDIMERAERLLLRHSQMQSFGEEIKLLKNNRTIPTSSKLLTLSPYLDDHGVLRAGGRIDAASDVPFEVKRPAILDGKDYIARMIVRHYHVNAAHANQELVVNEIKQRYWIIRLRPTVKNVVSKCMLCRLKKCRTEVPRMGDLPEGRMAHHRRPFTHCGIDLFGPMDVTVGRRHERRYGVLFTCLTVRAVHIETVSTLTTDSFIMALRRMAARRGWPQRFYSDNGTNLRGAHTELKKSIQELDETTLRNEAMNRGIEWTFIPPASPHWGGAWERLIRSVKVSLQVVLKERAPREEVFNTLLAEVENIVNSRPLTHVSVEPDSVETLTPNHFLIGTSSNLPQIGKFVYNDIYLRKQWRVSQRLADMFWHRWVKEILPELVPRKKWYRDQRPLNVGDVVCVVDPDAPRNRWVKGLVEEVLPGRDGRVRVVRLKTKSGTFTRSATRVARIPMTDECC